MTDYIFNATEQTNINAVKINLKNYINGKKMFWNGITRDCVISGGYFASVFTSEPFNDIDVFILNKSVDVYAALTDKKTGRWKILDRDAGKYLQNPHIFGTATNLDTKIQYILTDYKSRKELLDSFDYVHTTVSYVPAEDILYVTRAAFDAFRQKKLISNGKNVPKYHRQEKFEKRGWTNRTP